MHSISFSAALFPQNSQDEKETLSEGGIPAESLAVTPVTAELRKLLNETSDCLDAPDCTLVRKMCLDRLFSHLVHNLEAPFRPAQSDFGSSSYTQGSRFEDITERSTRLASLLPTVARQSHIILSSMPNEYVHVSGFCVQVSEDDRRSGEERAADCLVVIQALEDVRELTEFSAIIYSSFDRDNVRDSC
jgi:peroxin-3